MTTIRVGDIHTHDGRVLSLRSILQRTWGLPRRAADLAAERIETWGHMSGTDPVVYAAGPERAAQWQRLFSDTPEILEALLVGLARGSSRNEKHADRHLTGVVLTFRAPVEDVGLVADVIGVVAKHLGTSAEEVRDVTAFDAATDTVFMKVDNRRFL